MAVAHITTFQSAGMSDADAERLREHNRRRIEEGLEPIRADHYSAALDIVDVGSGRHAEGTMHHLGVSDRPGFHLPRLAVSHVDYPVTAAAMRGMSEEERARILPNIPVPEVPYEERASEPTSTGDPASRGLELLRRSVGLIGRALAGGRRSDISDIEAADRLARGDLEARGAPGTHEAVVDGAVENLLAVRGERSEAMALELTRRFPDGDPMNGPAPARPPTASPPAFVSLGAADADPVRARHRPAEIDVDAL
jgi:hypothetical protein